MTKTNVQLTPSIPQHHDTPNNKTHIHKEEDHHGDAAVEHGGADVVDEVRHQQTSHRHPDAVDGVDDVRLCRQ